MVESKKMNHERGKSVPWTKKATTKALRNSDESSELMRRGLLLIHKIMKKNKKQE